MNKKTLRLEKIVFSAVPVLKSEEMAMKKGEAAPFRPYMQVFKNSQVIFNDLVGYFAAETIVSITLL